MKRDIFPILKGNNSYKNVLKKHTNLESSLKCEIGLPEKYKGAVKISVLVATAASVEKI